MAANSTADAVRMVSGSDEPWAAIGTLRAAELYGCEVIARDIADAADNPTRFVLLGPEPGTAVGPGRFRTSIVLRASSATARAPCSRSSRSSRCGRST